MIQRLFAALVATLLAGPALAAGGDVALTKPLVIHGATPDIDGLGKERNGTFLIGVYPRHHRLLFFR